MKVLLAHNYYGSSAPSGENQVFEAEGNLLRQHGHEVDEFVRSLTGPSFQVLHINLIMLLILSVVVGQFRIRCSERGRGTSRIRGLLPVSTNHSSQERIWAIHHDS